MKKYTSPICVVVTPQMKENFEVKANSEGMTVSELIREWINLYLSKKTPVKRS